MPSRLSLFWEELSALEQFYVLPSLLWISAFGLDVFVRITANTIGLTMLVGTYTSVNAVWNINPPLWMPQGRRFSLIWRTYMDLSGFFVGQMTSYAIWAWQDAFCPWPFCNLWVFATQALHFDIAVYLISMLVPGNILQKLTANHTTGALDKHMAGFIAMLASVASISWMYYYAFLLIRPEDVKHHWQGASREVLSTWLIVTITTVLITLLIVRQGLKYFNSFIP